MIVCGVEHVDAIRAQLAAIDITPRAVIAEPVGRNTAPAAALAALCVEQGHEVVGAAEGGTEAVDLFKHLQPELVTLDYLMPDKSGEAVLDEIIGLDPGAKVIMISGSADQSITDRVLQKGAKSFLEKPDVQRDILQVVDQVMGA